MNSHTEFADVLLRKSRDDAYVVERLAPDPVVSDWVIGFHAQQAVEKAIKSVLTRNSIEFPRTHNIAMLLELLRRARLELPPDAETLPGLVPYGVALRYDAIDEVLGGPIDRASLLSPVARTLHWAI